MINDRRILGVSATLAWTWTVLAAWHFDPWPGWLRAAAALAWTAAGIAAAVRLPRRDAAGIIAAGLFVAVLARPLAQPRNGRDWSPDQDRLPVARFEGGRVTIENIRNAVYRSPDDYYVRWETRSFDLAAVERIDLVVEPFSPRGTLAHTFLTFGFADGDQIAISVEIRKEQGESYSPVAGLFNRYELMYVVGDERDLIGLRAEIRKNPVYLYPVRTTPAQARALFESMLRRANSLAARPEFYDTLGNTCTTNIIRHLEELSGESFGIDPGVVFPGFADTAAYRRGLLAIDAPPDRVRERYRINGRGGDLADGRSWSRRLRFPVAAAAPPR